MKTRSIAFAASALAFAATALAAANAPPRIDLSIDGTGRVWGWTYDPDDPARSLDVHFYVDGDYRTGTFAEGVRADRPRDDVRAAFSIPGDHGFEWRVPAKFRDGATHTLYGYALDSTGGAAMLYPHIPSFRLSASTRGHLDGVKDGFAWGWVALADDTSAEVVVRLYVDGDESRGIALGSVRTTVMRDDVNAAIGGTSPHGFGLQLPVAYRDGRAHQLWAYADGRSGSELIGTLPFTWAPPTAPPAPTRRESRTWSPGLRSDRHAFYLPAPVWLTPPQGSTPGPGMWAFGTTNETKDFANGGMNDMLPDDPTWAHSFHPLGDGRYQVGLVVDKVNFPSYLDRYSFAGFSDAWDVNTYLPKPALNEDLWVDVTVALHALEAFPDARVGDAKVRVMFGAVVRWNGVARYMEVNLRRSDNFDLVDASRNVGGPGGRLDPDGIYDRLANWGNGELVYYDGTRLDRTVGQSLERLEPDGKQRPYSIPITRLFTAFSWDHPPADWGQATMAGVYVGIEVWGRGRVWIEITDYDLYAKVP